MVGSNWSELDDWYASVGRYIVTFNFVEVRLHHIAGQLSGGPSGSPRNSLSQQLRYTKEAAGRWASIRPNDYALSDYIARLLDRLSAANEERNELVHSVHFGAGELGQRVRNVVRDDSTDEDWLREAWPLARVTDAYDRLRALASDLDMASVVLLSH